MTNYFKHLLSLSKIREKEEISTTFNIIYIANRLDSNLCLKIGYNI